MTIRLSISRGTIPGPDGDGIELSAQTGTLGVAFDIDADGFAEPTGWAISGDGLLARDENGNGRIDDVGELFGTQTMSGFAELATWDGNLDQRIDAGDAVWGTLRVWVDADRDGVTDPGELQTMDEAGLRSISLVTSAASTMNAGNLIDRTGIFVRADGTAGTIADVAFAVDQFDTVWLGDSTVSPEAALLPNVRGRGTLTDLHVAMTLSAATLAAVQATMPNLTAISLTALRQAAAPIFAAWAAPDTSTRPAIPIQIAVDGQGRRTGVVDFGVPVGGSWALASGQPVRDLGGAIITNPTYQQTLDHLARQGATMVLTGVELGFVERHLGQRLPVELVTPGRATASVGNWPSRMIHCFEAKSADATAPSRRTPRRRAQDFHAPVEVRCRHEAEGRRKAA